MGLASYFSEDMFWVSGRGPQTYGNNAFDWYELPPNPTKIAAILKQVNIFIGELKLKYPIDTNNVYLMGFSQGSMISLSYVIAFPNSISGAVSQSGALPSDIGLEIDKKGLENKAIMITHGSEDMMMPIERGRQSGEFLKKYKADVTFKEFKMGHTINNESITEVKKWLHLELQKPKRQ